MLQFQSDYLASQVLKLPSSNSNISRISLVSLALSLAFPSVLLAKEKVEFVRDIAPILETHCISCHYPGLAKGDVSLASIADLKAAGYIVEGKPDCLSHRGSRLV